MFYNTCFFLVFQNHHITYLLTANAPATPPTAIPAIAPPDKPEFSPFLLSLLSLTSSFESSISLLFDVSFAMDEDVPLGVFDVTEPEAIAEDECDSDAEEGLGNIKENEDVGLGCTPLLSPDVVDVKKV